tara:strand:+ start:51 stop:851 length:801 start_codon:yes stop_codon:yes gene_type:complete
MEGLGLNPSRAKIEARMKEQMELADQYCKQGKYEKAEPLFLSCLKTGMTNLGDCHPDTLTCMNCLAGLYKTQGNDEEAELYVACLVKRKAALMDDHSDTLVADQYCKPEPLFLSCLEKGMTKLEDYHPDILLSLARAIMAIKFSDGDRKKKLHNLAIFYKNQGYPDTLASVDNLALLYDIQGKELMSELMYEEYLEERKAKLGYDHPDTLTSMHDLACYYGDSKQLDKAKPLYSEVITRGILINHPNVEDWKSTYEVHFGTSFSYL